MPRRAIAQTLIALAVGCAVSLGAVESLLPDGKALAFAGDLGKRRANWTQNAWQVASYPAPRDFSRAEGVAITVSTDRPRADVEMYLALQEADGSWLYHPRACPLTAGSNTATVRFADFVPAEWCAPANGSHADENGWLDPGAITAIAVGTVNPFGVGPVAFTVTALDPTPLGDDKRGPVRLAVSGKLLDVNGTTMVPAGLFGCFHVPKGTAERYRLAMGRNIHFLPIGGGPVHGNAPETMHITTIGDRIQPSPRLVDKDWKAKYAAYGKDFAEKAKGQPTWVEFFNEPYLNWANRNRAGFIARHFDEAKAAEGGEVRLKIDGEVAPFLRWTKDYATPPWQWASRDQKNDRDNWRRGRDTAGKQVSVHARPYDKGQHANYGGEYNEAWHPPLKTRDGEKYTAKVGKAEVELTAFTPWHVYDESQFTFWSAKGMGRFYNEPLAAFAGPLKQANPEVQLIIGWGSRPLEDHFAAWELAYRDSIDAVGALADGVNDHDYGGDPLRMNASAEVVTAYGVTRHGKWMHSYNTECSASADPQAYASPGAEPNPAGADRVKYRWALRKLIAAIAQQPDKMRSFAFFGDGEGPSKSYFSPTGDGIAFDLLLNLRGRLVQAIGPAGIHIAAAIDGTDERNVRPATMAQRRELVVAVLNDHQITENVALTVDAPAGTTFASVIVRRGSDALGRPTVSETPGELTAGASTWTFTGAIPARDAVVLVFPLTGTPGTTAEVVRLSAFCPALGVRVMPAAPLSAAVPAQADLVALAARPGARAWLRLAVQNLAAGEAALTFNGVEHAIPAMIAGDNGAWLVEIALDPAQVKADNRIAVRILDPARSIGFLLGSVSVVVEGPAR